MDTARMLLGREKNRQHTGKGHTRIGHEDKHLVGGSKWLRDDNSGGLALVGRGEPGGVFGEGEFAGASVLGGRKAGEFDRTVADDFTFEFLGYLCSGEGHMI